MNDTYLKLAEGFEQLAQGYRALAGEPERTSTPDANTQPAPQVTIEPGEEQSWQASPKRVRPGRSKLCFSNTMLENFPALSLKTTRALLKEAEAL